MRERETERQRGYQTDRLPGRQAGRQTEAGRDRERQRERRNTMFYSVKP